MLFGPFSFQLGSRVATKIQRRFLGRANDTGAMILQLLLSQMTGQFTWRCVVNQFRVGRLTLDPGLVQLVIDTGFRPSVVDSRYRFRKCYKLFTKCSSKIFKDLHCNSVRKVRRWDLFSQDIILWSIASLNFMSLNLTMD